MKRRHMILNLIISLLLFLGTSYSLCYADGMSYKYKDSWNLYFEGGQYCAINYSNGIQDMILSVSFPIEESEGKKAVWIFPVPANPQDVKLNILKGFPKFKGQNFGEKVSRDIKDTFIKIRASQLYLYPFESGGTLNKENEKSIIVTHATERFGVKTELITAGNDIGSFQNYLSEKGFNIDDKSKNLLEQYIGGEYSFVVTWISDLEQYVNEIKVLNEGFDPNQNILSVSLKFPSEKIFFPLKLTSIYGKHTIPVNINIVGYVSLKILPYKIRKDTKVNYFYQKDFVPNKDFSTFFHSSSIKDFKFTKIAINTSSENLVEDLWIIPEAPNRLILSEHLLQYKYLYAFAIFIICSILSSFFVGKVLLNYKFSLKIFLFLGICNLLTIIGLLLAANVFLLRKNYVNYFKESIKFVLLFSIVFILLTKFIESAIILVCV